MAKIQIKFDTKTKTLKGTDGIGGWDCLMGCDSGDFKFKNAYLESVTIDLKPKWRYSVDGVLNYKTFDTTAQAFEAFSQQYLSLKARNSIISWRGRKNAK